MKEKPTVRSVIGDKPAIWLRCTFAMMVEFFGVWLVNAVLLPHYAAILPIAREAASVAGVATLALIAFTASRRPILLDEQRISVASLASYSLAFALIVLGILRSDPLLLLIGAILRVVSTRWVTVLAGISLCCLRARACMLSIATAYCASYALRILFSHASFSACMVALLFLPYLTYTACRPAALEILGAMRVSDPQAVSHITEPSSFLPLTHGLFIAILVFRFAYGFALAFGASDGVPVQTMFSLVPLAIVLVLVFLPAMPKADVLYQVAALFVVTGFAMALMLAQGGIPSGSAVLAAGPLYAGSECFEVLMWYVLASLGARNRVGAVELVARGRAVASAGLIVGALAGHAMNTETEPLWLSCGMVAVLVAFVAVNLIVLKEFSFQKTIDGVRPLKELSTLPEGATFDMAGSCAVLASDRGLTPREHEIMGYLARGRNAAYVQEKLVLSRNTVKTHVANIYAKLGVHSQQELIDMVEDAAPLNG